MTSELAELDSAIKSCVSVSNPRRIIYSKDFLLSIKQQVEESLQTNPISDKIRSLFPSRGNFIRNKTFDFRKTPPNKNSFGNHSQINEEFGHYLSPIAESCQEATRNSPSKYDLDKRLPEWYSEDATELTQDYHFESGDTECPDLLNGYESDQVENKSIDSPSKDTGFKDPKPFNRKEIAVPVLRTLRDIESKLNVKPSLTSKNKADTSAYYTLLGLVNDAMKRNSPKTNDSIEIKANENFTNNQNFNSYNVNNSDSTQAAINWIKRMRETSSSFHSNKESFYNIGKKYDQSFGSGFDMNHRNLSAMLSFTQYLNRHPQAKQNYVAYLAMQHAFSLNQFQHSQNISNTQMRQYLAAINLWKQHHVSNMHPGSPPLRGMPYDNFSVGNVPVQHKLAMNQLLQSHLDSAHQQLFAEQLNAFNVKREKPTPLKQHKSPLFKAETAVNNTKNCDS